MRIAFKTYGIPIPQGSAVIAHRGPHTLIVDSKQRELKPWRDAIRAGAAASMDGAAPFEGPVIVTCAFTVPRPPSIKPAARPWPHVKGPGDLDKLVRSLCDAMTGAAYLDDAQVIAAPALRRYPDSPPLLPELIPQLMDRPGVFVTVTTI